MKLKFLRIAAFASAVIFLGSCVEEDVVGKDFARQQRISAEISDYDDDQVSRSCVDVINTNNSVTCFLWQPGDQIGVYTKDGKEGNVLFTNPAKHNAATTEFAGEINGTPYYAYFPYSAKNDGKPVTALVGTILSEQSYDLDKRTLSCDYKYGTRQSGTTGKFKFKQLLTMLRITVDASGTGLQGERLNNVTLTITGKDGKQKPICGDFEFNAVNGSWKATGNTSGTLSMPWTTRPTLSSGKSYMGFVHIMPCITAGDILSVEVVTDGHKANFTATLNSAFKAGYTYNLPLTLKKYASDAKYGYNETVIERPTIDEFKFEVDNNEGKLLDNKLVWDTSKHTPSFSTDVASLYKATVNNETNEITLTIPYLYDFKLKPTFKLSTDNAQVLVNGVSQESRESEVDFTKPVTYTVIGTEGGTRDYTVKITNTGLPVVVVKHSDSGDFSDEKMGGTNIPLIGLVGARTVNTFVDFKIRGKEAEWVTDDEITIYNPDGTVDCATTGGIRHRGNTSRDYPKKAFAMKFNSKNSVLGMPAHKRWVLLANWLDHSMIRNAVAFNIAEAIEYAWRYSGGSIEPGIPWNVHGQNVELVVVDKDGDAHHVGNYYLCEQIKIDQNRLAITSPDGAETGSDYKQYGYLFEIDTNYDETDKFKTSKEVPFMFKDEVSDKILSDIQTKVQRIETNIYKNTPEGFEAAFSELDINSVIDQMLILELAMNREYGDPRSLYMYMDGDGKLSGGPVWDFDRGTFQNPTLAEALCDNNGPKGSNGKYYRVKSYNEWLYWRDGDYQETDSYSYAWYRGLAKSAVFQTKVQERWAVIKPFLDMVPEMIAMYGENLAESYKYDSAMWPTTKEDIRKYKSDFNDWSGDETLGANGNYQEVISNFITVYQNRLDGLNTLITSGKFTK